ncbi:hypothetical protein PSTT_08394 [Puccinia striiformis]|uniref:Uncharacterized protein n=2 Tax=Puccinia striiformis TaxID=27350 RepID=A0A2S4VCX4_9BASI|nr:hypothetical protein PSTT_08394 [Puccinia striiformis]
MKILNEPAAMESCYFCLDSIIPATSMLAREVVDQHIGFGQKINGKLLASERIRKSDRDRSRGFSPDVGRQSKQKAAILLKANPLIQVSFQTAYPILPHPISLQSALIAAVNDRSPLHQSCSRMNRFIPMSLRLSILLLVTNFGDCLEYAPTLGPKAKCSGSGTKNIPICAPAQFDHVSRAQNKGSDGTFQCVVYPWLESPFCCDQDPFEGGNGSRGSKIITIPRSSCEEAKQA